VGLSRLQARKSMNEMIFNLKKSYYTFLMTQEVVKFREDLVKKYEEKLRVAKILFRGGQRPVLDVSKAEVGLSEARLNFEKARNSERDARIQLFILMGIEDSGDALLLEEFTKMPELKYSVEDLVKLGAEYDPDIQIARINKKIHRAKIAIEKAQRIPTVDVFASAGYENGSLSFDKFGDNFKSSNWKSTYAFGFTARIPIYSGGAICAKVKAARAEYNKMVYREKEMVLSKRTLLKNSVGSLEELLKQVKMSKLSVKSAEKHLKLAKRTYQSGLSTQLELNDAIISMINAEMGSISTKYEYLITIAKISSIVGLGENTLCKK
jgi:outer membrane protein TolC